MMKFLGLAVLVILALSSLPNKALAASTTLTFCYENQELYPHYLGNQLTVPKTNPGAAIEIMQSLDKMLPEISISYMRAPWKRCLNHLAQNRVDAVIGRYSEERTEFGVYPLLDSGKIDTSKALSATSSCFIHHSSLPLKWDGKQLDVQQPIGLIAPMGYSVVDDLKALGFDVYEASNIQLAHRLLYSGKFEVSLSDCRLKQKPAFIVENRIPVTTRYGFLIFSRHYYWSNAQRAKFIWQKLQEVDKQSIYSRYP